MAHVLYVASDNIVLLEDLQDELTGEVLTVLTTANLTLLDWKGQQVAGQAWPLAMTHIGGNPKPGGATWANGTWAAVLDAALDLVPGKFYKAQIVVLASGDRDATFELPLEAATLTGQA